MIQYKPVKITTNTPELTEIIINVLMRHHGFWDLIVTDCGSLFISKFWSLLCYFFSIKHWFSTTFYLQTNGQTKSQNSTMESYLQAFVNFK